ncbi:MAG: PAS domain S-box protein [bacterium]
MNEEDKSKAELLQELESLRKLVDSLDKSSVQVKLSEGVLRESEERYRWMLEAAEVGICEVGIWEFDGKGNTLFLNDRMCGMLGCSKQDLQGRNFLEFVDEECLTDALPPLAEPARKQKRELCFIREDGSEFHGLVSAAPKYDEKGEFLYATAMVIDISERKRYEEDIKERERKYRALFENMHDAAFLADPETGLIVEANRQAEKLMQMPRQKIEGLHFTELHPPEAREKAEQGVRRHLESPTESRDIEVLRPDGSRVPVLVSAAPQVIEDKTYLLGIFRDITDRKRAEEELTIRNRVNEIMLTRPDSSMYREILKELVEFFRSGSGLFGYLSEDGGVAVAARRPAENEHETKDSPPALIPRSEWADVLQTAWNDLKPSVLPAERGPVTIAELSFQRAMASPLIHQGRPVGVIVVGNRERDYQDEDLEIFHRVCESIGPVLHARLERDRQERQKRLLENQILNAQKLESLGVLAGGIAHDYNNLLMIILGNASLALKELPPESPARLSLEEIETASHRAAELTKQLLAYSGKGKFLIEPVNLNYLLEEMEHLLNHTISKKAVLKLRLSEKLPRIKADPDQVRQVVMNLVTNSSEALGEKSGIISVTTGVMQADQDYLSRAFLDEGLPSGYYIYLEVSDNGCGMDEETVSKIFDPFFTTKFTGRGLGLAAVLGIVRSHSGTLKVYSEPGRGTTIKVLFPVAEVDDRVSGEPVKHEGKASHTVLVADDEDSVRNICRLVLEKYNCRVLTACDGMEALNEYRENADDIDVVLLDLTMPHMGGDEAFRELRRINPAVKVILTSGYSEEETTSRFNGKGLAGFIQKPFEPADLYRKLEEVLKENS